MRWRRRKEKERGERGSGRGDARQEARLFLFAFSTISSWSRDARRPGP